MNSESLKEIPEAILDVTDDVNEILVSTVFDINDGTKITALIADLEYVRGQDYLNDRPSTKSVVFSQFTSMLTLIEVVIFFN
jgi:hypothetical protein